MTPERWKQVDRLLQEALVRDSAERAAFLAEACGADDELRHEVESLLGFHDRAENFIETPPSDIAADLLAVEESRAGQTVGHYQLIRQIGRGGMGEVYLARDTRLGRPAALKLLQTSLTRDAARVRRFRQEARAASALNHPNILTIYEVGQADSTAGGAQFIAAEFVDGQTLRELCRGGGLDLGATLDMLIQVAGALAAAHEAGIIHRDIKPENIMLRKDGLVKVVDFGIAKLTEQAMRPHGASFARVTTQPGVLMGTVSYMSPEQARGLDVDERSDLFSLGVVMYETLTGRAPFEGETTGDVLVALLAGEPRPLTRYVAKLPEALQEIIDRALAKPVERRYQTARELGADLKRLKEELEFAARLKEQRAISCGANRRHASAAAMMISASPIVANAMPRCRNKPRRPAKRASPRDLEGLTSGSVSKVDCSAASNATPTVIVRMSSLLPFHKMMTNTPSSYRDRFC